MLSAITSAWPLLFGVGLIMLGNGLQGTLIGLRSVAEGFSTGATGIVMAAYFCGFLLGSLLTPRLVSKVGHVRVFAALASLASSAVLLFLIFVDPWSWAAMRLLTGFCYAGLYVVSESWLNDRATNETRGQLLAVYMILVFLGMGFGQLLLNVGDPTGFELFVLSSVLISLALIPILLSSGKVPQVETPQPVGLRELYRLSPLGVVSSFGTGMAHGTLLGMGAIYAESIGLSTRGVSIFMGVIFLGGLIFQWPLGRLSDHFERRLILTVVTILAAAFAVAGAFATEAPQLVLFATIFVFGGMCLPLYSLTVAHTNDNLTSAQMVAASGTIYIFVGVGATVGPIAVAFLMQLTSPVAFYYTLATIHGAIGAFALYRMTRRQPVPLDEQGLLVPVVSSASGLATALSVGSLRDQMDTDLAAMSRSRMRRR
jgi:MFS family permease